MTTAFETAAPADDDAPTGLRQFDPAQLTAVGALDGVALVQWSLHPRQVRVALAARAPIRSSAPVTLGRLVEEATPS